MKLTYYYEQYCFVTSDLSVLYPHAITLMIIVTIFDEAKLSKKKGQTIEDPIKMGIDKLRSELNDEEIRKAVTQPIKETISAGKSLVETFRSWLGPLITASAKSQ